MTYALSVVIPTFRRPHALRRCLDSFLRQEDAGGAFELIVVDDSPQQEGRVVVEGVSPVLPAGVRVRYLTQTREGPAKARNRGAAQAQGELIGFVDDDCAVDAKWVGRMVRMHLAHPEKAAVGGDTVTASSRTSVEVSQFLSTGSIMMQWQGVPEAAFFPTCNVTLKRGVMQESVFDESFPFPAGEDLEFFWRLFKEGHRFLWDVGARVVHHREDSLRSFVHQAYLYGRGNLLVHLRHPDQPLLRELDTRPVRFWIATAVNFLKIPRFCVLLGGRLMRYRSFSGVRRAAAVYAFLALHKVFYLFGNIAEYFALCRGVRRRFRAGPATVRQAILDISHECNLRCRMCDIWQTAAAEPPMPFDTVVKLLREAHEAGIPEIALSGGEPLLRKDIYRILGFAKETGIRALGLLTNGVLLEREASRLAPFLMDGSVVPVVSLDSLDPAVHNALRNSPHAHAATLSGLRSLSTLRNAHPRVSFHVITIVFDRNLEELASIAEFVRALGASSLQFQGLLANNLRMAERSRSPFWVQASRYRELDAAMDGLVRYREAHPGFVKNSAENLRMLKQYFRGEVSSTAVRCRSAEDTVLVSNQGTYTTCFSCYGSAQHETLAQVLSGSRIIQAREKVKQCAYPCLLPCFCDGNYDH